jgi:hypothetical protein
MPAGTGLPYQGPAVTTAGCPLDQVKADPDDEDDEGEPNPSTGDGDDGRPY